MKILTIVSARVEQQRTAEILGAYKQLLVGSLPDGLLQTRLVGDGDGAWAIHSLWRDRAALDAMRASGQPPAAPALFKQLGAEPTLTIYEVLVDSDG